MSTVINGITYSKINDSDTATVSSANNVNILAITTILSSVTIDGVTCTVRSIGANAFINCSNLTSLTILSSVLSIGVNAFKNCSNLSSLTIPSSVTSIGANAFENCTRLTSIIVSLSNILPLYNSGFSLTQMLNGGITITQMLNGGITITQILDANIFFDKLGLDIDGEATGDASGVSVSLSSDGTIVAIGANFNDGTTGSINDNRGHVRVYKYNSGSWSQLGLDIDGEAAGDGSGGLTAVSLSSDGTTVAIGARGNDAVATNAGHVRVYKYNSGTWTQLGLDIDGEAGFGRSGTSVSLSSDGTTVAIGEPGNNVGHVRVYKYNSGTWTQLGLDLDGEVTGDTSGGSVSISGDGTTVAIGAISNDGVGGSFNNNRGHTRVYKYNSGSWSQLGLDIDGEGERDFSGFSVSLSNDGTTVAIGAVGNIGINGRTGHVRVYKYNSGTWIQLGLDIDGEGVGDAFGYIVSLSSDGTTVAIGASENDGTSENINFNRGHTRVYKYNNGSWSQLGLDIDRETQGTLAGSAAIAVSLSSDGTTVAIGEYENDGTSGNINDNRGNTTIYKIINRSYVPYGTYLSVLKSAGYIATDLKEAGYTATQLKEAGYTAIELKVAGYTAIELKVAGYTATQLKVAGYTQENITEAGYTQTESPTLSNFSNISKTLGDGNFNIISPTSNSTGAFTYTSSDTTVASISGSTVTIIGGGTATITATQSETSMYYGESISCTLTVEDKVLPSLEIGTISAKTYGAAPFQLPVTSNSSGELSYSSSNTNVATISNTGMITTVGAGTTTITATQIANSNYLGSSTTVSLTVNKASPTISMSEIGAKTHGAAPFQLPVTSNSSGDLSYSSSNTNVATISNTGMITTVGAGTTTITASQAGVTNYNPGSTSSVLTVNKNNSTNPTLITNVSDFGYYLNSSAVYSIISNDIALVDAKLASSGGKKVIKSSKRVTIKKG